MGELIKPLAQAAGAELALADEFGETKWGMLDQRVNRLIHLLRGAGVAAGDSVAILSGNRREYYETMAAGSQAGWRYVPINWHWVAEEVAYVLANCDARALVVEARYADVAAQALAGPGAPQPRIVVVVGGPAQPPFIDYEEALAGSSPDEPDAQCLGGPMFYTSGTTGRPKGVVSSNLPVGTPLAAMKLVGAAVAGGLGLPANGRTFLDGPLYHSAQWAFSFLPLLAGSAVVMRHKFDAEETLAVIDQYRITNLHLVPTQFIRLLRVDDGIRDRFDGSSLHAVWHGAAPCSPEVKRQMIEWWGPVIHEYYGATEGGIVSTIRAEEWLEHPGSLGRLQDNVEARVIREDGEVAGPGEEGQLYFRSKMGADFEYHKDPEKTAAAHLEPGVFTFGDVGYLDDEGFLFMSDRKIDMIISGGVNIYPAEIEGVLVTHPAVADAAVFGIPNEEFGEEVKTAVELCDGFEASPALAEALVAHCREHLAGYKVPRSVDFETALPRHPTGKLYKRLLREPYWEGQERRI